MSVSDTVQPEPVRPENAGGTARPRVVLIGGASGSGKSFLARRHGRPHLPLDAFYREQSEDAAEGGAGPTFPRTPYGEIDWDDAATWNGLAAVDAIVQLRETGSTQIPDYDISTSSILGTIPMRLGDGEDTVADNTGQDRAGQNGAVDPDAENSGAGPTGAGSGGAVAEGDDAVYRGGGPIVAEGIFAAEMPALLKAAGVPFEAWYIDQSPVTTAVRRFARDVAERRKPIPFLVQRGWALFRSDGARRQAAIDAGFTARTPGQIRHDLFDMAGTPVED